MQFNWDFISDEEFNDFDDIEEFIKVPKSVKSFCDTEINDLLYSNFEDSTSISDIINLPSFNIETFELSNWIDKIDEKNTINIKKCFIDENNRIGLWYLDGSRWICVITEGKKFLIVKNIGCHPEVITPNFWFGNSDGSTYQNLDLKLLNTPKAIITTMKNVAIKFMVLQQH